MKHLALTLLACTALYGCSEAGTSGKPVPIPTVTLTCYAATASRCTTAANGKIAIVIVTSQGREEAEFNTTITASAPISCNAAGCSATFAAWVDANQNSTTTVISSVYNFYATIDLGGSPGWNADTGVDVTGELANVRIEDGTSPVSITSWTNI